MTSEELKKVPAPLRHQKDKAMLKKSNDILICHCQWVHVEKRERRVVDVDKHNINAGNSTDCVDITISDDAADGLIATSIDAGDSTDCADDHAGGLIAGINAVNLTDCASLLISDDAADELFAADDGDSMDCSDTNVLDDSVDGLMMLMDLLLGRNCCYGK